MVLPVWLENCTELMESTSKPKTCKETNTHIYKVTTRKEFLFLKDILRFGSVKPPQ